MNKLTTQRWIGRGSATLALLAGLVLVVLVNWLVGWGYHRLPAAALPYVRYDLTATRAHTLSPRTIELLRTVTDAAPAGDAPAVEVVGLFSVRDPRGEAVNDLLGALRRSGIARLTTRRIDPEADPAARVAFLRSLAERHDEPVGPLRDAVGAGVQVVAGLREGLAREAVVLALLADDPEAVGPGEQAARIAEQLAAAQAPLRELAGQLEQVEAVMTAALAEPLPPLEVARRDVLRVLGTARTAVPALADVFAGQTRRSGVSPKLQNALLEIAQRLRALAAPVEPAIATLTGEPGSAAYDRLAEALRVGEAVVVAGPAGVRVVGLSAMFRGTGVARGATAGDVAALRFVGEERLAGALVALRDREPPRVVLIHGSVGALTGPQGVINAAAERLDAAGFELVEWDAAQGGAPPPLPRAGQRCVWLLLPWEVGDDAASTAARARVAAVLGQRCAAGDGVLLSLGFARGFDERAVDPLATMAADAGIAARLGQVLLRPGSDARGNAQAQTVMRGDFFSPGPDVTAPLLGRTATLGFAHPLALDASRATPLLRVDVPGLWVETEPLLTGNVQGATPQPPELEGARDGVVVAAATDGEGDAGRLIVVADGLWLRDEVMVSMRAVGNGDLLVSAAYWLAGLDEAVGAGLRGEGLRLVGPMSDRVRASWQALLVAGLPVLAALVGVGVWLVRRRG